jgi:hypothetical protein
MEKRPPTEVSTVIGNYLLIYLILYEMAPTLPKDLSHGREMGKIS